MGYIKHEAVLATTWDDANVAELRKKLAEWSQEDQARVLIGPSTMNGYVTVILVPDGSKEGWDESDKWDVLRAHFLSFLTAQHWQTLIVTYGDDRPSVQSIEES